MLLSAKSLVSTPSTGYGTPLKTQQGSQGELYSPAAGKHAATTN